MEETITVTVFLILLLVLIIAFFGNIIAIFYDLINYFFRGEINRYFLFRPLKKKYRNILKKYSSYYNSLDKNEKKLFEKRVRKFMSKKSFVPRGGINKATDTMKTLISATAIQITFGLPGVYFNHFKKILIYPDDYYSRIYKRYHKGEVNPGLQVIILSWQNFMKAYDNNSEGQNLGIHEMAHALHIENSIVNREYNFLDPDLLAEWDKTADRELKKAKQDGKAFFREYANSNKHEFFAVAVEYFFERPDEFKTRKPEMYSLLAKILNQDPLTGKTR